MKTRALRRFRDRLARNEPVVGLWVTLESASITEMAVALGVDWVVVDAEHGHLDWKEINEHIRAAVRSDTVILVRVAERSTALCKRALDIGADGVVVPWVETAEQLQEAVSDCRYPPAGRRGIGGERATVWGQCFTEHTGTANDDVLVVPLIESVSAIPNVPAMCQVEGVDVLFFGPADFSATAGYCGQWEGPGVAAQIFQLAEAIRGVGKHCGVLSTGLENLQERLQQGFRMVGLGTDSGLLLRGLHQTLQVVQRDRTPATSLNPADGTAVQVPLAQPPAEMTPDRPEIMTARGSGAAVELASGVALEILAGEHVAAQNLMTGIVEMQPESRLGYHVHPCSESITVLAGTLEISVDGRTYTLGPLDNITVPRWLPHQAVNPDARQVLRMHVALAATNPERELTDRRFPEVRMPDDSAGVAGFERVTRIATASRSGSVGPNSQFVDYFNAKLMPGLEMSGGYARFEHGGRLPDHLHDFDESICIIRGRADCLVEGRRHSLSDCGTAMIPRGRVHFFMNQSTAPMEMIWVYAGPLPERIVIEPGFVRDHGGQG